MADHLKIDKAAVTALGATHKGVAAQIAAAGNFDAAGNVEAMTPVFGIIGADYLAMFALAQILHAQDINDLAGKENNLGEAAFGTVAHLQGKDHDLSKSLSDIHNSIIKG
jgi:hypothetical protein